MGVRGILFAAVLFCMGVGTEALAQTKVKAGEVVINGDSFFAAANIASELTRLARADGYIGNAESFRQIAVSGAVMSGILNQYKNSNPKPVYLITDGGGNDLMGSCGANPSIDCASIKNALNVVRQYFEQMKTSGTRKVLWMRYPDPNGTQWANLKTNQDLFNPEVEKICKASVEPQCLWVDLRPVWAGKYSQYTSDGIHCTNAGGTATAVAFWKAIKESDFFNLGAPTSVAEGGRREPAFLRGRAVINRSLRLSLALDRTLPVTLRIRTMSGQTVLDAYSEARSTALAGLVAAEFPLGTLKPGVYTLDVRAGRSASSSIFLMP